MPNIATRFITIAIVYAALGMAFGIWMGITQSFDYAHVHTHINLVGWATLALFGLVYRAFPKMAEGRLAAVHFWVANLGAIIFIPGIVLAMETQIMAAAIVGSLLVLASMVLFLVNFVRHATA
ncbi:MAG: cytochrome-c oxidase [Alphaproteobacteria bacterium]